MSNKVAAIQMASGTNMSANLESAKRLIAQAVNEGAKLIVLPESFAFMGMDDSEHVQHAEVLGEGPIQAFLSEQAKSHAVWIVGGTLPIEGLSEGKAFSTCMVFNDAGERVAMYNKRHLFDVTLDDQAGAYCESDTTEVGDDIVVIDTPLWSIRYRDLL